MDLRIYGRRLSKVTQDTFALVVVALLNRDPQIVDALFLDRLLQLNWVEVGRLRGANYLLDVVLLLFLAQLLHQVPSKLGLGNFGLFLGGFRRLAVQFRVFSPFQLNHF